MYSPQLSPNRSRLLLQGYKGTSSCCFITVDGINRVCVFGLPTTINATWIQVSLTSTKLGSGESLDLKTWNIILLSAPTQTPAVVNHDLLIETSKSQNRPRQTGECFAKNPSEPVAEVHEDLNGVWLVAQPSREPQANPDVPMDPIDLQRLRRRMKAIELQHANAPKLRCVVKSWSRCSATSNKWALSAFGQAVSARVWN